MSSTAAIRWAAPFQDGFVGAENDFLQAAVIGSSLSGCTPVGYDFAHALEQHMSGA
ncbi:hypothetical protein ACVWZ4_006672 [Bradyrhizobium sp. USDA 4472]